VLISGCWSRTDVNLVFQVTVIDYSLYMRDGNSHLTQDEQEETENQMQKIMDQKNYLEERNR